MVQELELKRVESEFFKIDGVAEQGGWERGYCDGSVVILRAGARKNFESAEEREWPGVELGELPNVFQGGVFEFEVLDLLNMRGKHCQGGDRNVLIDEHVQRGSVCAFEKGFHVRLALPEEHLGPQSTMMKEAFAPMTADKSGAESVLLGREVGGDEGKNVEWDAVDGSKRVPPFAYGYQRGRSVPVELRNGVQSEAVEEVSTTMFPSIRNASQLTTESTPHASIPH